MATIPTIPVQASNSADVAHKIAIAPKISRNEPMIFLALSGIISRKISNNIQKASRYIHDTFGLLVVLTKILSLQCNRYDVEKEIT